MKRDRKGFKVISLMVFICLFSSCIGMSMDITMRRDGSGRVVLEYRVSALAESLGRLDGNERWQMIPVGRADWERSIERLPGIRLVSLSSRERERDLVTNVTLEFESLQALVNFLDAAGGKASLSRPNKLDIILNEPLSSEINSDLLELFRQVSAGYNIAISFSADTNTSMAITDGNGREIPIPQSADIIPSGRKVSFQIGTAGVFDLSNGLGLSFSW